MFTEDDQAFGSQWKSQQIDLPHLQQAQGRGAVSARFAGQAGAVQPQDVRSKACLAGRSWLGNPRKIMGNIQDGAP